MKKVIITVDENDADYVSCKTNISDEDLVILESILAKMPKNENNEIDFSDDQLWDNDITSEEYYPYLTEKEKDFLANYLPLNDHGFHTITEIEVVETAAKQIYPN